MTSPSSPPLLSAENFAQEVLSAPTLGLHQYKVVLVIDLVESVHLMAANEAAVVERWMGFMRHAEHDVLPRQNGRLVKSLGDGLLAEFDHPSQAVQTGVSGFLCVRRLGELARVSLSSAFRPLPGRRRRPG